MSEEPDDRGITIARLKERADILAYLREEREELQDPQVRDLLTIYIRDIERGRHLPAAQRRYLNAGEAPLPIDNPVRMGENAPTSAHPLPADISAYPGGALPGDLSALHHAAAVASPPLRLCGMCEGTGRARTSPLHYCCVPSCPGMPYKASEIRHPCKEDDALSGVDAVRIHDDRHPHCPVCRGAGRVP